MFENGGPLKPNVYTNAAGYLRIGSIDQFSQTQEQDADYGADNTRKYPEPLDVTRIHPADYLDTKVIVLEHAKSVVISKILAARR